MTRRAIVIDVGLYLVMALTSAYGLAVIKTALIALPADIPASVPWPTLSTLILGTALYGLSLVAWAAILGREPFSFAMPASIAVSVVTAAAVAVFELGETLSPLRLSGIVLIIGGLALLSRGSAGVDKNANAT